MSVIEQFDLEFDELHACLNAWMAASAPANEDLQQKRAQMGALSESVQASSAASQAVLAEVDALRAALSQTLSAGQAQYLEQSAALRAALTEFSGVRDGQAQSATGQLTVTSGANDSLRKGIGDVETDLNGQFTQVQTTVAQSKDLLAALRGSSLQLHEELDKTLDSMSKTLDQDGNAGAKHVRDLKKFLDDGGRVNVPADVAKVLLWISDTLGAGNLKIVDGVHDSLEASYNNFKATLSQTLVKSSQAVSAALTTANTEIETARQAVAQHYKSKSVKLLEDMVTDQGTALRSFKQGTTNVAAVAQKLGEVRGKFEAVKRNV